jgi:hypothetical protein
MNRELTPLTHMPAAQVDAYADWLDRITKGREGSIAERFRNAARALRDQWRMP